MNTAVVNIRLNKTLKEDAQALAEELGLSLSTMVHALLKQVVRTRKVELTASEEPSEYFIKEMKRSEADIKAGRISPAFTNAKDAIKWLNDPNAKYEYQLRKGFQKGHRKS